MVFKYLDVLYNVGMKYPLIVLNFKAYAEALGERSLKLALVAEGVASEAGVEIAVCPQYLDVELVASRVRIPVFAQHVDPYPPGPHTGSVTAEALKVKGVVGSLLNHSEKRVNLADIATCISRLRMNGLQSLLCTGDQFVSMAGAALNPDIIAVEPPELIGTGVAVSRARPEVISETVENVRRV
ncbi:MAG: triose-phosphate isomerase, partial [Nitrososphaerota archaeon]